MATTPWESDLVGRLREHFGEQITEFSTYLGQNFLSLRNRRPSSRFSNS